MADQSDLDIDGDGRTGSSSQQVRKNINIKLKSSPKGKGRGRKLPARGRKRTVEDEEPIEPSIDSDEEVIVPSMKPLPGEPVHQDQRLNWNHKVQLIGEKVLDPAIHCCEKCNMPILIYGRMIPCKHVFCFDCAKKTEKNCPRCNDAVIRIEQSALGTVFVCRYGGSKHAVNGCRRTYLSQRDLQAHIDHRHLKTKSAGGHSRSTSHSQQHTSQQAPAHHQQHTHSGRVMAAQHTQPMAGHQPAAPQQQPQPVGHDQLMYQQHQRQPDGSQMHHVPPQQGQPHHQTLPQQTMPPPQQGLPLPQGHQLPQQDHYHTGMEQQPIHPRAPSNLISVPIQDEASRHQQAPSNQSAYQGQTYSHPSGSYPQSQAPPQQHYPPASQPHHPPSHSTGPYTSAPYTAPPQQAGIPPHSAPPAMRSNLSQTHHTTAPHHGAPPPRSAPGGPPRYPSPHNRGPYDEQYSGSHSPRTWGTGGTSAQGPGPTRGPPQTRTASGSSGMGPPPTRQQQQYY